VIFILLAGARANDTFDFKFVDGITPTTFNQTVNGIIFPRA